MPRWSVILGALLGVQLLIAGALLVRQDPLTASVPDALLLPENVKTADRVLIEAAPAADGAAARVELVKRDGVWTLPGYFDAPANAARIDTLLTQLSTIKRGLPTTTSAAALKRFKVTDEEFERRITLSQGDKQLVTLYLGSSLGVRKSNARTDQDKAVYAIDLPAYDWPTQQRDWFNNNLLQQKPDELVEITLGGLKLSRDTGATAQAAQPRPWRAATLPAGKQLDTARVATLVSTLTNLRVDEVLGRELKAEWQQNRPVLTLTLKNAAGNTALWTLSKPAGGAYVLKTSSQPWYLSLNESVAKSLLDAADSGALVH